MAGSLWVNGAGLAVQLMGYAAMLAMGTMLGLHALRSRTAKVAAQGQNKVGGADRSEEYHD